ncbi:MAG: ATP synthase F1 subunit gamma [Clostridia bacterium]|nr:ATP synthase F1 subunit gamma [Clostridia bacterium]
MGVDIKSLKNRIKSINSTLHLTKAMGLVASAKIRGATMSMQKGREYSKSIETTVEMLCSSKVCERSPYMNKGKQGEICLVSIAGDRGLAGGFNTNVFKLTKTVPFTEVIPIGKRACEKFGGDLIKAEGFEYLKSMEIAKKLCGAFKEGEYEKVGIVYTKYKSMMVQEPEILWILPLEKTEVKSKSDIIFEPDEKSILESVVEEYVASKILETVRESFTCEVVARRFAMDNAEKNAGEMIDNLTLEYNRARQGAITQEITEIVAGSGI